MKIGITADCSSGVEYASFKHNIKITRTTINFKNRTLIDGIDIKDDEFYKLLEQIDEVPSTSAPSIGEIKNKVKELKEEGCTDVIHFSISSGLSPYADNLRQLSDELFNGINVHFFKSRLACLMQGYVAHYGEILSDKGYNVDEIMLMCDKFQNQISAYFIVDNLKYLVKNGRLTSVAGFIGSLVNIKPILRINEEGKIVPFEKVRTKGKAIERMEQLISIEGSKYQEVIYLVLHSNRLEEAKVIAEKLKRNITNAKRVEVTTITPTVGAHIGSGVLGIACIAIDNLEYKELI